MSSLDTFAALTTQLVASSITGINTTTDIAYPNDSFDPAGKAQWLACYYQPATSEMLGKSAVSANDDRGFFQVSIFTKRDPGGSIAGSLAIVDDIKSNFVYNTVLTYNNQQVEILDSVPQQAREVDGWFQQDITINYLTFSQRG
tara:strand:+ start:956 stop:1387 length:432 start_codon:yes stop_codon:yes gene_type:complete